MGLLLEKNCLIVRCEKTVLQIRAVHVTGDLALMSCRISTRRGLAGSWLAISNSGSKLRISLSTMSGKVHCPLAACVGQYLLSLILTFFFMSIQQLWVDRLVQALSGSMMTSG